ncbi:hypothetical protein, partial [Microcoleus sp. Aus8_D4]|uniref:hypothetical protein n=1 Tax=Microcoleus sp. Aus8_D4 TaxID=2818634 RepID=UPI002FD67C2B
VRPGVRQILRTPGRTTNIFCYGNLPTRYNTNSQNRASVGKQQCRFWAGIADTKMPFFWQKLWTLDCRFLRRDCGRGIAICL